VTPGARHSRDSVTKLCQDRQFASVRPARMEHGRMEPEDVLSIIEGLFHANANLMDIEGHLKEIRYVLGEEPDDEEEETAS